MECIRSIFVAVCLLCVLSAAKTSYFWHITDTHIQTDYKPGSDPQKGCYDGTGNAGQFGDYNCRPPFSVEQSAMLGLPDMIPDECPDQLPLFVLWTGDSAARWNGAYSQYVILHDLMNITRLFDSLYQKFYGMVPIYPIIGNHDTYPQHQFAPKDFWVYSSAADLWEPFLPKTALDTLKVSGFYSVKVTEGLRLVVLNTLLYFTMNNMTDPTDSDPANQIAWLQQTLADAKKNNEAVYIAGHVPIRGDGTSFRSQYVQPLMDAMKPYQSIIMGSFWGHHHTDTFQLIGDSPESSHVGHVGGSIDIEGNRNPTFRRYMIDTSKKFALTSWKTFYMDLPAANKEGKITWKTLLDSKKDYGLDDLSPESIQSFTNRLKTNQTLFDIMWNNRYGLGPISKCDESCQKAFICSVLYTLPEELKKCNA